MPLVAFPVLSAFFADEENVVEAYVKIYKLLFSVAYKILGDLHGAEDIVHDVFHDVSRCDKQFNDERHLYNWMSRVCANKAITAKRRKKHQVFDDNMDAFDNADAADVADDALTNIVLDALFSTIPPEMRDPLQEHILDGQKVSLLCKKYGVTRAKLKHWRKMFLKKAEIFYKDSVQNEYPE